MKQFVVKIYGTHATKYTAKVNDQARLTYQDTKTEWNNRKRKTAWNMPLKNNG